MKNFISIKDVKDPKELAKEAIALKKAPFNNRNLGNNLNLGLIFLNPSLRTRMSTQRAAMNLGLQVMVMNLDKDGWALETEEGVVMDGNKAEHIIEAAGVIGQYCDIIGVRSFPGLTDRDEDYSDYIIKKFIQYSGKPVISLESAILHPLQSLADLITIEEHKKKNKPKVVLSWAPHVKALPQAVPNSFAEWMNAVDVEFVITHPKGYELNEQYSGKATIEYDQKQAFEGADFIYAKNWSSFSDYGKILTSDRSWTVDIEKMSLTNNAKFMHCLPVRRNVVVKDEVLDSPHSLVMEQANNRIYAAQAVLLNVIKQVNEGA